MHSYKLVIFQLGQEFPDAERKMLRTAAAARMVQSLVLGAYNHSLDPTNDYLLTTAKQGWTVLHQLWSTSQDDVDKLWDHIQASYAKEKS